MKYEDLNDYPEYPDVEVVEQFCNLVLDGAEKVFPEETLGKLRNLGDKHWHSYKYPSKELRIRIKSWIINSGILDTNKNLLDLLVVSFYFALDKEFYKMILNRYSGKNKWQFERDYENSVGEDMDPWWSLKKNENEPKS